MGRLIERLTEMGVDRGVRIDHGRVVRTLLDQYQGVFERVGLGDGSVLAVLNPNLDSIDETEILRKIGKNKSEAKFPYPAQLPRGNYLVIFSDRGVAFADRADLSTVEMERLFQDMRLEKEEGGWKYMGIERGRDVISVANNAKGLGLFYEERKVEQLELVLEVMRRVRG